MFHDYQMRWTRMLGSRLATSLAKGANPRLTCLPTHTNIDRSRCYAANVKSHLWIMQAAEEDLARNNGSCVIIASTAGLCPGGSSMVRVASP